MVAGGTKVTTTQMTLKQADYRGLLEQRQCNHKWL